MKEQLEALNALTINFGAGGMTIVNIILAFVMFGVALGIKLDTFKEVLTKPKSVILGILLQWVGLPAVTFLAALLLSPCIIHEGIAVMLRISVKVRFKDTDSVRSGSGFFFNNAAISFSEFSKTFCKTFPVSENSKIPISRGLLKASPVAFHEE